METTALSVGKSVLSGALGYAKSAFAEEVALHLGILRDHAFIRDELEMMLAFLMAARDEQDKHQVVMTWVKQVRDTAYDAEDSLQDFAVRLGRKPSWWRWRIFRYLPDRHRVAKQMKELRVKVEDVSQRNQRYQLIKGSDSKAATRTKQSSMSSATLSGTEEAMRQRNNAKMDLIRLIHNKKDRDLRVIAVWGTNDVFGETSIIKWVYDYLKRDNKFECQAWIRITKPFNPMESLQNIIRQFFIDSLQESAKSQEKSTPEVHDLRRMRMMKEGDLIEEFKKYLNEKSYLIALSDLSTIEDWNQIKVYFPNNKKGSRLIVCTEQDEVASSCVGLGTEMPEHKHLSTDPTLFAFFEKVSQEGTYSMEPGPSSSNVDINEKNGSADERKLIRMGTVVSAFKESHLIGRVNEISDIIKLISDNSSQQFEVISICGMGGLGKTALVKYVYQSQELSTMFDKRACITVKRPFNPDELLSSLAMQLGDNQQLPNILEGKKYLIALDDLSSTEEWDAIIKSFPRTEAGSRIIVTTRVENIAKHCSKKEKNIRKLQILGEKDACNLFTEKVFGKITDLDEQYPELAEVAKLILKKCNGLPLAIVTIGGFLSKQPKTPIEWRKLNDHIGVELEMNQEIGTIKDILVKSYDGLPYHLKSCFLYMSIFPEDHNISRRRLVRRWIAEGYSSGVRSKTVKDIANSYFMELIDRNMILAFRQSVGSRNGVDSCQIHDLMREISISKSMEENLVFRMEEGCSSNTSGTTRHLSISRNWEGNQKEFESLVDLSRVRSLTVFGRWKPFFISDKMRLLRVLDLEGTSNLFDHHLTKISKLLHLKFLSLRGCNGIFHLPDSLGDLKQLETLDIYGTRIVKLQRCIIKLRKLQYIRAGGNDIQGVDSLEEIGKGSPKLRDKLCFCTFISMFSLIACCSPDFREEILEEEGDSNRHDCCTWYCHFVIPFLARLADPGGVVVPKGLRQLKALHTLGVVNIAREKSVLQEIKCMVQLRKLAVSGINKKNSQEFCCILAGLSCLESLSVMSNEENGLHGLLDDVPSPPISLQSLKLKGKLVKLPKWIGRFHNLVKFKLWKTKLWEVDGTLQVLGKLPNLAILCLWRRSFQNQKRELNVTFHRAAFPSLMVLEISDDVGSLVFEEGATPKLELLQFDDETGDIRLISGLASLPSLKEVMLKGDYNRETLKSLQAQLAHNKNGPFLKGE